MEEKKKYIIIGIIILLIIIGILIWFFLRKEVYKKEIGIPEDVIFMKVGEIKLLPFNADENDNILFESSNPDIAKIDRQGYIYAYELGKTLIKIYYESNPNSYATCEVHVVEGGGTPQKDSDETEKTLKQPEEKKEEQDPSDVKPKATCKLSVSKDGIVKATTKNAIKYGFDKNNIDALEISRHVRDIPNKEEHEEEGWTYYRIKYYVQNEAGTIGSCTVVIVKKCNNANECIYEVN